MHGQTSGQATSHIFVRSALLVSAFVFVLALLLLPIAAHKTGLNGPNGLAGAAAICVAAAIVAEAINCVLGRAGSHLAAVLFAMATRFTPPIVVCLMLSATGASGRQNLAFIGYLLAFYLATLAAETWLAVKRAGTGTTKISPQSR
jgi:hypothetical protein